jgi:hypothetical protein
LIKDIIEEFKENVEEVKKVQNSILFAQKTDNSMNYKLFISLLIILI